MATHDHAIVDAMRRRVVQLERGRIIRDQAAGRYDSSVVQVGD
jgi:cell division transport system ATP-binding protein